MLKKVGKINTHSETDSFQQRFKKESTGIVENFYLLELILVLMAFTFSEKAVSVFIFFSTCWME